MKQRDMANLLNVKYVDQLKELFGFYSNLADAEIDQELLETEHVIQLKSFIKFGQRFKVIPHIVNKEEAIEIFRSVVKSRPGYGKRYTKALSYEDFLEALIRACAVGKHNFGIQSDELLKDMDTKVFEMFLKHIGITQGNIEELKLLLKKVNRENDKVVKDYSKDVGSKKTLTRNSYSVNAIPEIDNNNSRNIGEQ